MIAENELKASDDSSYCVGVDTFSPSPPWQTAGLGDPPKALPATLVEDLAAIDNATALSGALLGPGSLTWRYLGDTRNTLLAARAGILQVMHPAIDAGVREHSDFFANPWNRIIRSAGPILGVVFDEDSQATGQTVRDFHRPIKGTLKNGSRYAALDPETYFWAHATFFEGQIATQELFGTPLSDVTKAQLYAESITWYERYGLSMRPVPRDYDAFQEYWQRMLDDVLQPTSLARASIRKPKHRLSAPLPWTKGPVWALLHPLVVDGSSWLVRGTLPPRARELLEVEWSRGDERRLRSLAVAVRLGWDVAPARLRRLPRAHKAFVRAGHGDACSSPTAAESGRRWPRHPKDAL
jgi:uncharacterized protein (DUF2236 family)